MMYINETGYSASFGKILSVLGIKEMGLQQAEEAIDLTKVR